MSGRPPSQLEPRRRIALPEARARVLPDVAAGGHDHEFAGTLDRVGVSGIATAVRLAGPDGVERLVPARAEAFVDLADPSARGIHVSRLLLGLQDLLASRPLGAELIAGAPRMLRESHAGLSTRVDLDWLALRPSLVSGHAGWRTYPARWSGSLEGATEHLYAGTTVTDSSTCPCSAALARQLVQVAFDRDFGGHDVVPFGEVLSWLGTDRGICATPHSQRSHADVLRNRQNTTSCEDAARRIRARLDEDPRILDDRVRCSHEESRHPHDAVSVVTRGVPGGLAP